MGNRFSELLERLKDYRSRIGIHDRATQLTAASIVLIVALIAVTLIRSNPGADTASTVGSVPQAQGPVAAGGPSASTAPGAVTATAPDASAARSPAQVSIPIPPGVKAAPPGVNAQGVTDKEILVGDLYDTSPGSFNTAFGAAGIGQIDLKRATETVVKYINSHGGIGGRKIKIQWHSFDSKTANGDTLAQEVCTDFTQDHPVFASMVGGDDNYNACWTKAGVPSIVSGGVGESDSKTFKDNPYFVGLGGPAYDRLARLYVDELHAAGYYSGSRTDQYGAALGKLPFKLGVVSYDAPAFDRAIEVYRDALAGHGIKLSEVAQIKRAESNAEAADEIAATQQAALRFKQENITHVQFLSTGNGLEQLDFWVAADTQRYYPRYGLSSNDPAQALKATLESKTSTGAFTRTFQQALGVGWTPLFDVAAADYSGAKESAALQQCRKILSHEKYDDASRNKEGQAALTCDSWFYLKAAVERGGQVVNQRSWLYGVANIGSVPSAWTFDMKTTVTRHDGMAAIKNYTFGADDNFHYNSGIKPV